VVTGTLVHVTVSVDTDNDGIPDAWERQYLYCLTNATFVSDSDNDNSLDGWEYIAGTDPTNRGSVFAVTDIQATSTNAFVLQWFSITNKLYSVSKTTNLLGSGFAPLATNLPATPPLNTYTDQMNGLDNVFYRIGVGL
jgi:hypothetical protein